MLDATLLPVEPAALWTSSLIIGEGGHVRVVGDPRAKFEVNLLQKYDILLVVALHFVPRFGVTLHAAQPKSKPPGGDFLARL